MTEPSDAHDRSELAELRTELAELRAELADLRSSRAEREERVDAPAAATTSMATSPVDRRSWMKAAAAAAVGGTALALGASQPAAAASNMQIGSPANQDASRTSATHTGTDGAVSFLFTSRATHADSYGNGAAFPAALGGWTYQTDTPNGVYGFTNSSTGNANGVVGFSNSVEGAGVLARSGARAGVGLRAVGGTSGWGVEANGQTGVYASGTEYGVQAVGDNAAIYIPPVNEVAPPDRGVTQSPGALETHTSNLALGTSHLWFCVDGGVSGGDWRKLAGPDTAGSFHAIEPFRAYDSRRPAPAPGRLSAGDSRVVSVADARDDLTGALVTADAVPAGARAVTYNVTVTATVDGGFLAVTPGDATSSPTSAVNWSASGSTSANAGVVKLDGNRQIKVFCGGVTGSGDFIIDITGYYL